MLSQWTSLHDVGQRVVDICCARLQRQGGVSIGFLETIIPTIEKLMKDCKSCVLKIWINLVFCFGIAHSSDLICVA